MTLSPQKRGLHQLEIDLNTDKSFKLKLRIPLQPLQHHLSWTPYIPSCLGSPSLMMHELAQSPSFWVATKLSHTKSTGKMFKASQNPSESFLSGFPLEMIDLQTVIKLWKLINDGLRRSSMAHVVFFSSPASWSSSSYCKWLFAVHIWTHAQCL